MWRVAQASVVGTAHLENGGVCEDAGRAETWCSPSGEPVLALFAADGAGSASCGKAAAELACSAALEKIRAWALSDALSRETLTETQLRCWVELLREQLLAQATCSNQAPREWACTLLGVVCIPGAIGYLQIGDGAIVARHDDIDGVIHWPQSGEYANETFFLTDSAALKHLQVLVQTRIPQSLALFTDGLQRLALDFARRRPHLNFFETFFARLRALPSAELPGFEAGLHKFLSSARINQRTDDDKTLLLASWQE
jgi:ADP-ribose pyrophosphatase YjhB (NUDIX family)